MQDSHSQLVRLFLRCKTLKLTIKCLTELVLVHRLLRDSSNRVSTSCRLLRKQVWIRNMFVRFQISEITCKFPGSIECLKAKTVSASGGFAPLTSRPPGPHWGLRPNTRYRPMLGALAMAPPLSNPKYATVWDRNLMYDKCTKHHFIHLLPATFKDLHIENSKNYKRWYCPHHTDCVSMCCWITSPFVIFAVFDVQVLKCCR